MVEIRAIHAKSGPILWKKVILLGILDLFIHVKGVASNFVFLPVSFFNCSLALFILWIKPQRNIFFM